MSAATDERYKLIYNRDVLDELNRSQIKSVIATNTLTKTNIYFTAIFAMVVTGLQIKGCYKDNQKEYKETIWETKDSVQQAKQISIDSQIAVNLYEIQKALKDKKTTAKSLADSVAN